MTVQTWSGLVIHIHLIDEITKPARLKRIVEHATGNGIGTLFIVDANLLPRPGEPVPADRWYLAVHALAKDHLYAYYHHNGQPALRRVDFVPVNRVEVEARYGADVDVANLRYFRHNVKFSAVKGYWLLADFETDLPPKSAGFRPPAPEQPPPRQENHQSHTPPPSPPPTRLEASYALLGVSRQASREEVKAAFRKLAFEVHPDVSNLPKDEAEARFKRLSEAYEYIKVSNRWI
ncbi:MAG: J domain-containing protein [Chloroflexi bacterium]|nr:J domain-containing protein [Chloroflexota bacterium]